MKYNKLICIRYKFIDNWHVFESNDIIGLYIANKDLKIAYEDIIPSIKLLCKLDQNIECEITGLVSYDEFLNNLDPIFKILIEY